MIHTDIFWYSRTCSIESFEMVEYANRFFHFQIFTVELNCDWLFIFQVESNRLHIFHAVQLVSLSLKRPHFPYNLCN